MFLECMSVISRSMLRSRIMVGANTTARFFGDIYSRKFVRNEPASLSSMAAISPVLRRSAPSLLQLNEAT